MKVVKTANSVFPFSVSYIRKGIVTISIPIRIRQTDWPDPLIQARICLKNQKKGEIFRFSMNLLDTCFKCCFRNWNF